MINKHYGPINSKRHSLHAVNRNTTNLHTLKKGDYKSSMQIILTGTPNNRTLNLFKAKGENDKK